MFTWKSSRKYTGHYHQNLRHGFGVMTDPNTGDLYEGQWKQDRWDGDGKLFLGRVVGVIVESVLTGVVWSRER